MEVVTVRDYQLQTAEDARRALLGLPPTKPRRVIIQADTGAGKSVIALELVRRCWSRGLRALFVARGRELVHQFSRHLESWSIPHGILMRGEWWNTEPVQVASKSTFESWVLKRHIIAPPPADLLVIDECHESLARGWVQLIESYPRATVVGLTATPARADGRGLGSLYSALVCSAPPSRLIADGYLVPSRVYAPYVPGLKGVPLSGSDYQRDALCARMDRPGLVGDVVTHWLELARGRTTIVYASGVSHSLHLMERFRAAGVNAEHLDGTTEAKLRDGIVARLTDGSLNVLCNVGCMVQGVDVPRASCAVLACPTRSYVKFRQACGRIKRPFPGKENALLLDHAGAVYAHGWPDEDVEWDLSPGSRVQDRNRERKTPLALCQTCKQLVPRGQPCPGCGVTPAEPLPVCPKCLRQFPPASTCPHCGHRFRRRSAPKELVQGKLVELDGGAVPESAPPDRQKLWTRCLFQMAAMGRTAGAAAAMYRVRTREWPTEARPPLKPMPRGEEWKRPVVDLYPEYLPVGRALGARGED
jgi:DNA repair protein RadD